MPTLPGVQAGGAALWVVVGVLALLCGIVLARRRLDRVPPGVDALLGQVPEGLGDAALLLDGQGRVRACNATATARLSPGRPALLELGEELGNQAAVLRRGIARGPARGRFQLPGGGEADAVLVRVRARPVRDLLVLRFDRSQRPPPLPAPLPAPPARARAVARADLAALGGALLRPIQNAATAAALMRLTLPAAVVTRELQRVELALEEAERRIRWLRSAGEGTRRAGDTDLAVILRDLLAGEPEVRARLRSQSGPAHAWIDAERVRAALREVVHAAIEALPPGGVLESRAGTRAGAAFVELGPASADGWVEEASALARALLAPEGGTVEVEALPGRRCVCRISLPTVAGGDELVARPRVGPARAQAAEHPAQQP